MGSPVFISPPPQRGTAGVIGAGGVIKKTECVKKSKINTVVSTGSVAELNYTAEKTAETVKLSPNAINKEETVGFSRLFNKNFNHFIV